MEDQKVEATEQMVLFGLLRKASPQHNRRELSSGTINAVQTCRVFAAKFSFDCHARCVGMQGTDGAEESRESII